MRALSLWNSPVRLWFNRVDEVREFMGVLDKKHRCIISYQVKYPLFGIKLCGKSANIPDRVC
ncbi:hypothetical protein D3C81_2021400 [compost metagenome]